MIVVLGAMDSEISEFLSCMVQRQTTVWHGYEHHRGLIDDHEVLVSKSGVGKVLAAMMTQHLIDDYRPDAILFTGLAGSLRQAEGGLILSLKAEREISFPQRLRLRVLSPVRAGWDQVVWLEREEGLYRGRLESLPAGHWNLVLEDAGGTWKIPASVLFPLQAEVSLLP